MNLIRISGANSVFVSVASDAFTRKNDAIESALMVSKVVDQFTADLATEALRGLKAIEKDVEASRKTVKAPVLDIGRKIDATADEFVYEVKTESRRLESLLSAYIADQRRREAEELARLREEEEKRKAEEVAKQRELERQACEASNERERLRIEAERRRLAEQARIAEINKPVPVPSEKPAGSVIREDWTFEVEDVHKLHEFNPDLVELTPKRAQILSAIRSGARDIPGLRIFQKLSATARAA